MKTLFEILPFSIDWESCTLICEVSSEGVSYAIKNEENNLFTGVGVYQFDVSRPQAGFPIALQILFHQKEWLTKKFKNTVAIYSTPESTLVPFSLYNSTRNIEMLNLVLGDLPDPCTVLTDLITEHELYNVYRISSPVYNAMQAQFPNVKSMHQYSAIFKNQMPAINRLSVIFYTQKMVISLAKDGMYQLINSYPYHTAEDVSYVLLNICQQYDLKDVQIEINGLIEKKSGLFEEIYKYFSNIAFADFPKSGTYHEAIYQYPSHYFSHIFEAYSCE